MYLSDLVFGKDFYIFLTDGSTTFRSGYSLADFIKADQKLTIKGLFLYIFYVLYLR